MRPDVLGLVLACVATGIGLAVIRVVTGPIPALSPIAFVSYCQVLLFVARPAYAMYYQHAENIFTMNKYDESIFTAQLLASCGFIALCIGYAAASGRNRSLKSEISGIAPFTDNEWSRISAGLYGVVAVGYGLYALYIAQMGWSSYWSATLSGRSQELRSALSTNSGYLYSGLQFATGALLLIIFQNALRRHHRANIMLLILLTASIFPQIASGSRSIFIPVIVALLYILYIIKPSVLHFSRVVIWAPALFLFGFVAPRIWRDNLATGGTLSDSLQIAMTPENLFDNFFGGLDTAMLDAFTIQVSAQASGDLPPQMGRTYLSLISAVIPRGLWPGKPDSVDELLNAILFPETNAKHIGFAFGFYSEPYFNFGIVGVILVTFLCGTAMAAINNRARRYRDIRSAFILMMVVSYIFPLMRGSLSFDSQRLLISLLPVLIVFLLRLPRHRADELTHPIQTRGTVYLQLKGR